MNHSSQCLQILSHLQKGNGITHAQAFNKFRISRLAARIYDLKQKGHPIVMHWVRGNESRYGMYILKSGERK